MNFDEFIDKYLGKELDWDGVYAGQCTDLYRYYVKEVLGFKQSVPVGGAAEIWDTADPALFEFIKNSPLAVPKKGDIVVWNRNEGGGFGHVAIFIEGGVMSFTSLDQNWPTLSVVTKTKHTYKNVIGWLRPRVSNMPDDWIIKNSDSWIGILTYLKVTKNKPTLDDAKKVIAGIKSRASVAEKKVGQLEAKATALEETISTLNDQLLQAEKANKTCNSSLTESERNLEQEQGKVRGRIEEKKKMATELAELRAKRKYDIKLRIKDYFIGKYK